MARPRPSWGSQSDQNSPITWIFSGLHRLGRQLDDYELRLSEIECRMGLRDIPDRVEPCEDDLF